MEISVRYIKGEPAFDSLEVIKLVCDRSVDINDRIFGQTQLGRNDDLLFAKILSFESEPDASSSVMLELSSGENTVCSKIFFDGRSELSVNGISANDKLSAYIISGEDLQGEYWGAVIMLPLSLIFEHFSLSEQQLPCAVYGNIHRCSSFTSSASLNGSAKIILNSKK